MGLSFRAFGDRARSSSLGHRHIPCRGRSWSDCANAFASELQKIQEPRTDTLPAFDLNELPQPQPTVPETVNEHQGALATFGHFLEQKMSHVEELATVGYRALKSLDRPLAPLSVAKDRFLLFLHHGQAGRLGD